MKFLKALFQFYVYSNLHVAIAVACLVLSVGFLFGVNVHLEALLLLCATFVSYHLIRFLNRYKYGKKHLLDVFSNEYKVILYLLIGIAVIVGVYVALQLQMRQFLYLLPFVVLTLLYAYSFIGRNGVRYSIRFVPGIKIFIIAIVWVGTALFFPVTSFIGFNSYHLIYFIGLMSFVIVLTLPFDIRDLRFDEKSIKTLPMILGLRGVKILGAILLLFSLTIHYYIFKEHVFFSFLIVCMVLFGLLLFAKEQQSKYYASFWVEGIPILYYIVLLYL